MDKQAAIDKINERIAQNNLMSIAEFRTLAAQVDASTNGATLFLNMENNDGICK